VTFAPIPYERFWNTDANVILLNTLYIYKMSCKEVNLFMILEMFPQVPYTTVYWAGANVLHVWSVIC